MIQLAKGNDSLLARLRSARMLGALLLMAATRPGQITSVRPFRANVPDEALADLRRRISKHRHPGEEIIYVLERSLEYQIEDKPPVTLNAGDVLFIPAGTVHAARNVGSVKGAELATYVVERGKPLVVPVQ